MTLLLEPRHQVSGKCQGTALRRRTVEPHILHIDPVHFDKQVRILIRHTSV